MGCITVKNKSLCGTVTAIASKSVTHRALMCAALSGGKVNNALTCADTEATRRCLEALMQGDIMDAGESATTLRLLIPLALHFGGGCFRCGKTLIVRPMDAYRALGIEIVRTDDMLKVRGKLNAQEYNVDASVSSQFVSGLLLALPLRDGNSRITLMGEATSRPYMLLTLEVMRIFGVNAQYADGGFNVAGGQSYDGVSFTVEGDWSYAANFVVANALGGNVVIEGLDSRSSQGDRAIGELISMDKVDMTDVPDLLPILAVNACGKHGTTLLYNTARLKYKESARPAVMANELNHIGADVELMDNALLIRGNGRLIGGEVNSMGDHRVAMAFAIAAAICETPVTISAAECVGKSAPGFFNTIERLGGI